MRYVIAILFLTFSIQIGYSQACGIYRVRYVGELQSENVEISKIKLPSIPFLHGYEDQNSELAFIEFEAIGNRINKEIQSHLTSDLFDEADTYLKLYQGKRKKLPIKLTITNRGEEKEVKIELSWDEIEMSKIEDEGFGNLFEINLKEIKIKN